MKLKIVGKAGAWYEYNGGKIGQGRSNAMKYLAENPVVAQEIEQKIRDLVLAKPLPVTSDIGEEVIDSTNDEEEVE